MKKLLFKLCVKSYGELIAAFEQDSKTVLPNYCNGMTRQTLNKKLFGLSGSEAIFYKNLLRIIKNKNKVFWTFYLWFTFFHRWSRLFLKEFSLTLL